MTIVNLYGTGEEINQAQAAANGVELDKQFRTSTGPHGGHARMNSNADLETTIARLEGAGYSVHKKTYYRAVGDKVNVNESGQTYFVELEVSL